MTISVDSFYPTADDIIRSALELLRVIDIENPNHPTTNQKNRAMQALEYMLSGWQADGLQLWTIKTTFFSLIQGTEEYAVGYPSTPNEAPLKIVSAWRRDITSNIDVPLKIVGGKDYDTYTNKLTQGTPIALYFDAKYDSLYNGGPSHFITFKVYPTPDSNAAANYKIWYRYQRPFRDFNALTDAMDFPKYWMDAIKYGLAVRLAPIYGTPMLEYDRIKKVADDTKEVAMGFDQESTSLFIQPAKN